MGNGLTWGALLRQVGRLLQQLRVPGAGVGHIPIQAVHAHHWVPQQAQVRPACAMHMLIMNGRCKVASTQAKHQQ